MSQEELDRALMKLAKAAARHVGAPEPEYLIVQYDCAYCGARASVQCWRCKRHLCRRHTVEGYGFEPVYACKDGLECNGERQ